ncbi:type II secretion system F family protein [Desulfitibacter alkalitolerans]|uniref:type II secretion system F family protein n=1 Tax=Desulfitibacter alkalitolerans TaxID=264641 RepID=UPI00048008F7|nr:type II secretion system F family protein [Desulfitibacter alkalitolerans]
MSVYSYEVVDNNGNLTVGEIEADDFSKATRKLREKGYMVVDIKETKSIMKVSIFNRPRKVKLGELSLFSRQLAAMLDAGIPLTRALFTLSKQIPNPTFKKTVSEIASNVEGGFSFTEAISAHPKIFNPLYVGMIKAGEVGGTLEKSLLRLSDQLQKDKSLRDNIRAATFYPTLVLAFACIIFTIMMVFVVPIFVSMFPADIELPMLTKIVVGLSDMIRAYWYLWIIAIVAIMSGIRYYLKSPMGSYQWDKIKLKLPVFGELMHKAVLARFSRTLSTLLSGGIPVLQALEVSGAASGNLIIAEAVNNAREKIQEGRSIAEPLDESGMFPPMAIHMISVGEETGSLSTLLTKIAEFFEDEVTTMTKGLTSLLEPILLIVIGILVGGMVMALYLPIFTAITTVGG